ncbi:hypothetical protein G6F48_000696 [Rhizopus delemar]|nr:hypothetical protein G6F54_002595 [Rhizopus delemar]KAG1515644.1 hypothetical protein G6F53_002763 [Rhizopus delemar]KAG1595410.1 hypothetical protein G6F48_000696 [Rhizopus delemar]KAG1646887.1 hypothetical protein G6F44_000365 [Rhizopus delemar]
MATEQNPTLRSSPSSTNIYSRYQLPSSSTTTATTSILSDEEDHTEYKKSYTMDNLSALGYFTSADTMHPELTPSAAIRDRYYQSTRYLQNHSNADEEDLVYEEESIAGSILDYRPGDSELCTKPEGTPSIYSIGDSVISLRTEYNDDANSITSIRTVDDRLQGRSISHLNSFAVKTAKKVSRSGTLFRSKNGKTPEYQNEKKKLEPFMPIRDNYSKTDNSSAKTTGGMSLLSKLSKSTAPMRAKLSALSAFSSRHSRVDSSLALSGRKRVAESVYNMPVSVPSSITITRPLYRSRMNSDRSSTHHFPRSLSASSSTSSNSTANMILSSTLVEEPTSLPVVKERLLSVYPALLSKVAEAFKESIVLTTKTKDSIKYKDVFDGKEAVDKLSGLIKSSDRNLALLLGRALDAQKFFHDVNYEHRLRDSSQELYQFREHLRPLSVFLHNDKSDLRSDSISEFNIEQEDGLDVLPTGVFTVLTDCYSPTCTRDKLCYSVRCPRRQEQVKNNRGHSREGSQSYLIPQQEERLWINTVPQSLVDTLSKDEKKRQENIYELVYTEKDFIDDLKYMIDYWMEPLLDDNSEVTGDRAALVDKIFWNVEEVYKVNCQLSQALLQRQSSNQVVDKIGDIMLAHVKNFEPFVKYGAHQIIGKYAFETEKSTNPSFAEFVSKTERLPQSRKLELNGYLTKPTTRLGRYNLLLREILKHTPNDHPDQKDIPEAMAKIAKFLSDVNRETGITENRFELERLDERLVNKHISNLDLDLLSDSRQIIMKGTWKKSSGSESSDILVYLLDHCLLIIKPKQNEEKYKLYRKPIPLALLSVSFPDQNKRGSTIITLGRPSNASSSGSSQTESNPNHSSIVSNTIPQHHKNGFPMSFVHLGKQNSNPMTLYAPTLTGRKQWADKIEGQRRMLVEKHKVFNVKPINQSFFSTFNKVNCIAVFDNGKSFVLGGDQGVYLKKEGDKGDGLTRILAMDKVLQIDILEQSNLILVLADKILYTYSLDTLLPTETNMKRGRKLSSHVSFFKVGKIWDKSSAAIAAACATATSEEEKSNVANGVEKTLVCFVRYNAMTSTIRALEPCESTESKKKNKHLNRLIRGNNDALKVYKDLYIPGEASSIQFFKNIICVGSARGFQMVNLSSAEVQSVLDPNDDNNNALLAQHEYIKPISMFRHKNGNILLCYNELAFYIDKKGKRVRKDWCIAWEGNPTAFAFKFPYVVAFNTNFIEVRHIDTGDLLQVIPGTNIRCLRPDSTEGIHGVMDDRIAGNEIIFELDLYEGSRRKPSMIKNREEERDI